MTIDELPKMLVAVFVFIRQGDSILLVRQGYGKRFWSLPGGVVETGETLEEAALREVREETGLEGRITRVVGLYSKPDENALAITLEGEVTEGNPIPGAEVTECGYFALDALPSLLREHFYQRLDDYHCNQTAAFIRVQ